MCDSVNVDPLDDSQQQEHRTSQQDLREHHHNVERLSTSSICGSNTDIDPCMIPGKLFVPAVECVGMWG
jgi:hypothetical protein